MSRVGIIIDNPVQFYSVKEGIDRLVLRSIPIDIYIPKELDDNRLADYTYNLVKGLGYAPLRESKNSHYKVLLEPYPKVEHKVSLSGISYDYRIKYKYGLLSTKPNPEYSPRWTLFYDAMMVFSSYEYDTLRIYTDTHLIKDMKYTSYVRVDSSVEGKKKQLLYMPTFADVEPNSYKAIEEVFDRLKHKYKIIVKSHHATQFREYEKDHYKFLKSVADRFYDSSTPLYEVLTDIDVVLTGNSGSIFDAMYLNIPVAVYIEDLSKYDNSVTGFHNKLINEGVIPRAKKPENIPYALNRAFKLYDRQHKASQDLFKPEDIKVESFEDVIELYLNKDIALDDNHKLRVELRNYLYSLKRDKNSLEKNVLIKQKEIDRLNTSIDYYTQSTSWRITRPLRAAGHILRGLIKSGSK